MQTIIMTSDKYLNALKPFMYLWDKYFQPDFEQENIICGFTPPDFPLSPGFKFYSIGKFEDYPVSRWSNGLLKVMDNVADDVFMLMLEDYWLTRHVNTQAVKILYDYMRQFRYVLKMDLCGDRLYAHGADMNYGKVSYLDLIKSMPGSAYHMSLMGGLWSKALLKKVIIQNETPWDIEISGTIRLSQYDHDMVVLGTRQWPLRHTLAFRGGDSHTLLLDEIQAKDVQDMRQQGLLDGLE